MRKKLAHFAQMAAMGHVHADPTGLPGTWASRFAHAGPVVAELGCGRGVYTVELARRYPNKNFIGVDVKGSRMWHGATAVQNDALGNAAFVRTRIERLPEFFAPRDLAEIWVTFPDPHPRDGSAKRRLTSPRFLAMYRALLGAEGLLHLKTDDPPLFAYTLELLESLGITPLWATHDLYGQDAAELARTEPDLLTIQTTYEERWLAMGRKIHYLRTHITATEAEIRTLLPPRYNKGISTTDSDNSDSDDTFQDEEE